MNFVWKTKEEEAESIVFLFFGGALIVGGWDQVRWGRKSYLIRLPKIVSFSSQDFSRSNKLDPFSHVVSTGYLYVSVLRAIAVSDFRPLEIYKKLGLPLSTFTFTVNSHGDNHFYKCIYLFQLLYTIKSVFLSKYILTFFVFKFDLIVKHRSNFF